MNDKAIEYLELMENRILIHVDTKIVLIKIEIIDIVDPKIKLVKTKMNENRWY